MPDAVVWNGRTCVGSIQTRVERFGSQSALVVSPASDASEAWPDSPVSSDTHACYAAIAERGAAAVIPPRRNGKLWKEHRAGATARNEALGRCRRLGRAIRKR